MKLTSTLVALLLVSFYTYAQPDIMADTNTLSTTLEPGATDVLTFTIANSGTTDLDVNLEFINLFAPGQSVSFEKVNFAVWTIPTSQDRISENVWIARKDNQSLFNAKTEGGSSSISPDGTEWAIGDVNSINANSLTTFQSAHGGDPRSLIGQTATMHLTEDDAYYNVEITSYSGGNSGGGFAYTRTSMHPWMMTDETSGTLVPGEVAIIEVTIDSYGVASGTYDGSIIINSNDASQPEVEIPIQMTVLDPPIIGLPFSELVLELDAGTEDFIAFDVSNTGLSQLQWSIFDEIEFTKEEFADPNQEENQDWITENVILTRGNERPLYNVVLESSADRNESPLGTEWALGPTVDATSYGTLRGFIRPQIGNLNNLPGNTLSLHSIEDDEFWDIEFLSWSSSRNGGGFSYIRREAGVGWLDFDLKFGTVAPGESQTVTLTYDATNLTAGVFHYDLLLRSNDPEQLQTVVPITLIVSGDANINTTDGEQFGDVLIGNVALIDEIDITNTGSDDLIISDINISDDQFTTTLSEITLAPGESDEFELLFVPDVAGVTTATMTLTTNDPDSPEWVIELEGTGISPPAISVSSFSLTQTLEGGSIAAQTLTIENTGDSDLDVQLSPNGVFLVDENRMGIGGDVFFEKENNADFNLPENQDWITSKVILTRGSSRPLFNVVLEDEADRDVSPLGTEWAILDSSGEIEVPYGPFVEMRDEIDNRFSELSGIPLSMHLIEEDIFLDVEFSSWTTSGNGGGFSYVRTGLANWLELSENVMTIAAGESHDITVYFDSEATLTGTYNGAIDISTNVPTEPELSVEVELIVTSDPPPTIAVSATTLDASVAAGNTGTGSFTITNSGDRDVEWSVFLDDIILRGEDGKPLGPNVTITKANFADWTLEENQDRITPNVWITRQDNQGIFNIAQESSYDRNSGRIAPIGTEWALGSTIENNSYGTFYSLRNKIDNRFNNLPGTVTSLHLIDEDLYFDVEWLAWTTGGQGGGFSYKRTELVSWLESVNSNGIVEPGQTVTVEFIFDATLLNNGTYNGHVLLSTSNPLQSEFDIAANLTVTGEQPPVFTVDPISLDASLQAGTSMTQTLTINNVSDMPLDISALYYNDPISFTKDDFSDWTLPENQDRISENLWITRQNNNGLFNIVFEDEYGNGPLNTEWSRGNTLNPLGSYTNWRDAVGRIGQNIVGPTFSMYSTQDDQYYDVTFESWTRGRNGGTGGGGFSYTRRLIPNWFGLSETSGTLDPGESIDVEILFDATDQVGGTYMTNFFIMSGAVTQPQLQIPVELVVSGVPNIDDTSPIFDLEDGFVDLPNIADIEIINSGTDDIIITNITSNNPAFVPSETEITIRGQETYLLDITFTPDAVSVFQGSLTIANNDPDTPSLVVELFGMGVGLPAIELSTTDVTVDISGSEIVAHTVTISNTGLSDLVWEGRIEIPNSSVSFVKPDFADWKLEENQDRITDNIWITRANIRGLFNIAQEDSYNDDTETPKGTLWADGNTLDADLDDYESWEDAVGSPPSSVGQIFSLRLVEENLFFDVLFESWTQGTDEEVDGPGGFAYTRTQVPTWLDADVSEGDLIIAAGESVDVVLMFDSNDFPGGSYMADIIIDTNIPDQEPLTINTTMNVTNVPEIQEIDDLEFGDVFVGGNSIIEVEVVNNGLVALNVTSIASDIGEFTIDPTTGIVEPKSSETIDVIYTPTALTANTGTITISSDDPDMPELTFMATGAGISGPTFEISPNEVFEVTTVPGGFVSKTYTITNNGSVDLNWELDNVINPNEDPVTFTKEDFADWMLEENQDRITETVWITRGANEGIFNIARENDYNNGTPAGTIWAAGTTVDAFISETNYISWRDAVGRIGDNIIGKQLSMQLTDDDLYFDVVFDEWSMGRNGGTAGGGFSYTRRSVPTWVDISEVSGTVAPGESQEITVSLDAGELNGGMYGANLVFGSNLFDDGQVQIETSLTVLGTPEISVEESAVDFEEVFINETKTLDLIISNVGDGDLIVSGLTFDESAFSADVAALTITADSEFLLPIHFTPTSAQSYTGTLTITHDDPVNIDPIVVDLSGQGVEPPVLGVDKSELSDILFFGQTSTQTFTIENTGGSDLEWRLGIAGGSVTFTKDPFADWTLPENQDRITDNVWLTRQSQQGLFNIVREDSYDRDSDTAPAGTQWAIGSTKEADGNYGDFRDLRNQVGDDRFRELAGTLVSLHLLEDNLFFDLLFHQWSVSPQQGGGFSYTRTPAFSEVDWVFFSKTEGVIAPGGSEIVEVIFNPIGQADGDFFMNMEIQSNDEASGPHSIPTSLSVSGLLVQNPIDDQLENEGFGSVTIDIADVFVDAQDDPLNFTVISDDANIITTGLDGTTLTLTEAGIGTTNISLTADDGKGSEATEELQFRVNAIPTVANALGDLVLIPGFSSETIDISGVFADADNDVLSFTVASSDETIVTASLDGGMLTITEVTNGGATITLTADDGFGGVATETFDLSVILSIPESLLQSFVLYPNPTDLETIQVRLEGAFQGKIKTRIIDVSGLQVKSLTINKNVNLYEGTIDINGLASGNYILELSTRDGKRISRFVKE